MATDEVYLVTGSTDGVGRRLVEKLARPGVKLLVHGRDADRGRQVVEAINQAGGLGVFLQADFASLDQVRALAEAVRQECGHLAVLVNNAGIAAVDGPRQVSRDGFELHMAVNYLAPVLLTHLLRPVLGGTMATRIVNVASAAQAAIDFNDLMLERSYSGYRAYGQSKLADIMFTFDAAAHLADLNITANCLHPASFMDTGSVRAAGITPINSVDTGADAIAALAIDPVYEGRTGLYLDGRREARADHQAYDPAAVQRLRSRTIELLQLDA